jgi:predicted RNA methylase
MADIKLTDEVKDVLHKSTITSSSVTLPRQLPRAIYVSVDKVLKLAGGRWNKGEGRHVFSTDPRIKLGLAVQTGTAVDEKKKFQFYPTPPELAARVAERARLRACSVLEPSAGHGALVFASMNAGANRVDCFELNPETYLELKRRMDSRYNGTEAMSEVQIECADFLTIKAQPNYDRVVMNPPFRNKQDLKHIAHATGFLKPGGRLVAILFPHTDEEIESYLGEDGSYIVEDIPAGTFSESGTEIPTRLLILDK